ncbi:MAG: DUF421 domain-containing protein [Candidatus Syntrophonatronum acetioxidans]|uniref:DUF421 domain-containing protein n=1 Tax=Candidatus Syntrophonatronum acetioxidans TaxID=1795816 RepID=A0A424YBR6_9FIRM|nr:MAG: DUF421 domain-containing protein [Candidatus Syntrophonatronum acetioxidans]
MFVVMIRTVILYILVFVVMRLMGKRQVGQLQPYELAVAIMISALAAVSMEDISIPLINSIIPIVLIMSMQIIVSTFSLNSKGARNILCGRPSVVVENGKIVENELKSLRVNLNDILEQLRLAGYYNISDVEFAIMETNGQLSVIPKSQKRPLNPEDIGINTSYEGLCHSLIIDGEIDYDSLRKVGLREKWLQEELKKFGIKDIREVFFASIDVQGKLYFQKKDAKKNNNMEEGEVP